MVGFALLMWDANKNVSIVSKQVGRKSFTLFKIGAIIKHIFYCNAKLLTLGPRVGLDPQNNDRCMTYTNMLVSKNVSPNVSQWNIVRFGYARIGFALGT